MGRQSKQPGQRASLSSLHETQDRYISDSDEEGSQGGGFSVPEDDGQDALNSSS